MDATTKAGKALSDTRILTIAVGDATDPETGFGEPVGSGSGQGSTSDDASTAGGSGGRLPKTGSDLIQVMAVGMVLLVIGVGLVVAVRRRTAAGLR